MKKLVVLSGAGISAESGLKTFRDAGGLWEGHDILEVATPEAFEKNPDLVNAFYNQRRRQMLECEPNEAHRRIKALEQYYDVHIVTQNVDDLHERAGSTNVMHLHGELLKVRSTSNPQRVLEWRKDLQTADVDENGDRLRPHIVWFGEAVPLMEEAARITAQAEVLIVIGTSLSVYPAAGLLYEARPGIPVYYIDPKPATIPRSGLKLEIIPMSAVKGMETAFGLLKIL